MGRDLYENLTSDVIKKSKNLAGKVEGVFRGVVKKAQLYGMAGILFYGASSLALPNYSKAQPVCGDHKTVSDRLKKSHDEAPVSMGITIGGGVIEVYASEGGTWTLVITQPNGLSCLIAA